MKRTTALPLILLLAVLPACGRDAPDDSETDEGGAATTEPTDGGEGEHNDSDEADELDALYQAALDADEESVVIYGPGQGLYQPVYDLFTETYPGIEVTPQELFGAELNTRLDQEFTSGQHVGSIQFGGAPITAAASGADRCQSFVPETADYLAEEDIGPDDVYRAVISWAFIMEYNSDTVSEEEVPTSYAELTGAEWAGRVVMSDPTTISATTNALAVLDADGRLPDGWLEDMAANDPYIAGTRVAEAQAMIARGERDVLLVSYPQVHLQGTERGLPVANIFPVDEGAVVENHWLCLLENAPGQAGAELLINWLYTQEAQEAFASLGVYPRHPDAGAPEGFPLLSEVGDAIVPPLPVEEMSPAARSFADEAAPLFQ